MINTHAIAHFVAVGYEKLAASFYFGFIGFIRIGATLIWGSLSDRLGRSRTYAIATTVTALGVACMIALTFGAPLWLVYLTVILYGVGHSAGNPTYGSVIGDIFSGHKIGLIFGFLGNQLRLRQRLRLLDRRLPLRRHRHLRLVVYRLSALLHHLRSGDPRSASAGTRGMNCKWIMDNGKLPDREVILHFQLSIFILKELHEFLSTWIGAHG